MNKLESCLGELSNQDPSGSNSDGSPKDDGHIIAEFNSDVYVTREDIQTYAEFSCGTHTLDACSSETPLQIIGEVQSNLDANKMIGGAGEKLIMSIITSADEVEVLTSLLEYIKSMECFKTEIEDKIQAIEKQNQHNIVKFVCNQTDYCFFGSGTYLIKDTIKSYDGIWGSFIRNKTQIVKGWYISKNAIEFMNQLSNVQFVYAHNLSLINLPNTQTTSTQQMRINKF
tara:strand:- start:1178 stop:1861 length:684 start_codon:yes stop_codon:yes gene_type:complete